LSSAYVTDATRVTRIVIASCLALYPEKALLGELYMDEDAPVANDGDDERQRHAQDDEEYGVSVGGGAVPHALLRLAVEPVRRPADVVRRVEGDSEQPRRRHCDDRVTTSGHRVVGAPPAHVQVTVDGDQRDGEQRHDAADDAEARRRCTQPVSSTQ